MANHINASESHLSSAEAAYLRLREMIIQGELKPGQVLQERELSDRTGIGRTPVREAVQKLSWQKIVTVFPRRGIVVAKLGISDVQEIFEAREAVESKLAELAAVRRTDKDIRRISRFGEYVDQDTQSQDFLAFLRHDQDLHRAIASAAQNGVLNDAADHLLMLSSWIWHQYFKMHGSQNEDYFDHQPIISGIVSGNAEAAKQAMAQHIQDSHKLLLQTF